LVGSADRRMAFLVDAITNIQDVVTKSLPPPLFRVRHLSGATVLGSGEVVTILNASDLIRTASQHDVPIAEVVEAPPAPVIVVVDDSATTRTLESTILSTA